MTNLAKIMERIIADQLAHLKKALPETICKDHSLRLPMHRGYYMIQHLGSSLNVSIFDTELNKAFLTASHSEGNYYRCVDDFRQLVSFPVKALIQSCHLLYLENYLTTREEFFEASAIVLSKDQVYGRMFDYLVMKEMIGKFGVTEDEFESFCERIWKNVQAGRSLL